MIDEPSVGLDPRSLKVVAGAIKRMTEAEKTLLIVEQNVRFGLRLATHGVVMESGRVLMHDDADAVLNNPEMTDLFFGGTATTAPRHAAARA
jgi:branched-chain amino acid transport system ATP-binding protein